VAEQKEPGKKKGRKGGIKHTTGRGHDTKSGPRKKKRFETKAAQDRQKKEEAARKLWKEWDELSEELRQLLGPKGEPKVPRPKDED
jgi:hypothetical protein